MVVGTFLFAVILSFAFLINFGIAEMQRANPNLPSLFVSTAIALKFIIFFGDVLLYLFFFSVQCIKFGRRIWNQM